METPADAPVPDGTYDILVVDGSADESGSIGVEVVVTAGPAKGETVWIGFDPAGGNQGTDPIELLGLPGTLTVEQGAPRLTLDA